MKLEEFKDLLSVADRKMCETKMVNGPTWYPLTLDVFVKFLYKVILFIYFPQSPSPMFMPVPYFVHGLFQREISAAADIARRLYHENTPVALRSAPKIWEAMTKTQDRLIKTIRSQNFEKYISVADKDGDDFFHEVPILSQFIHFFLVFLYMWSYLMFLSFSFCGRLTVIFPPFSSRI
jgi:hypothetical protein